MENVETFAHGSDGSGHLSRRRLIQVFGASLVAAQLAGMGIGGREPASAVAAAAKSPPAYDGIVGLL